MTSSEATSAADSILPSRARCPVSRADRRKAPSRSEVRIRKGCGKPADIADLGMEQVEIDIGRHQGHPADPVPRRAAAASAIWRRVSIVTCDPMECATRMIERTPAAASSSISDCSPFRA